MGSLKERARPACDGPSTSGIEDSLAATLLTVTAENRQLSHQRLKLLKLRQISNGLTVQSKPSSSPMGSPATKLDNDRLRQMLNTLQALPSVNDNRLQSDESWRDHLRAFVDVQHLLANCPSLLAPHLLGQVARVAAVQISCLRSTVAKAAINLINELIDKFGPALDAHLEIIVPPLIKRAGTWSVSGRETFLAQAADAGLAAIVARCTPAIVVACLVNVINAMGTVPGVRAKAAWCMCQVLNQGSSSRLHLSDKLIMKSAQAGASFSKDGASDTRHNGRKMLQLLQQHTDSIRGPDAFRKLIRTLNECSTILSVLQTLDTK